MNKVYTIIATVVMAFSTFAQAPEKMSYQAVIRDSGNNLVSNQSVGMQISILQGSTSGTAVYVETQNPTTNVNGLVSLEIGNGTVVSGIFNAIDWSIGTYFVKTETDPTDGTAYTITGTSQMLSVPYALHATTATTATTAINGVPSGGIEGQILTIVGGVPQWAIPVVTVIDVQDSLDSGITPCQLIATGLPIDSLYGKTWAGGLIFYFDALTCKGLVAAPTDQSISVPWGCFGTLTTCVTPIIPTGDTSCDNPCPDVNSASQICSLPIGSYNDWFLPTSSQLSLMHCFLHLRGLGGFAPDGQNSYTYYWSSTEILDNYAMMHSFSTGRQVYGGKNVDRHVRAIRAF